MSMAYRALEQAEVRKQGYRRNEDGIFETVQPERGAGFVHMPCIAQMHKQCGHPNCTCPCHQAQQEDHA